MGVLECGKSHLHLSYSSVVSGLWYDVIYGVGWLAHCLYKHLLTVVSDIFATINNAFSWSFRLLNFACGTFACLGDKQFLNCKTHNFDARLLNCFGDVNFGIFASWSNIITSNNNTVIIYVTFYFCAVPRLRNLQNKGIIKIQILEYPQSRHTTCV